MGTKERELSSSVFGTLLRRYRLAAGLSQEALAELARMSTNGIGALERGERLTPQRETLALLAQALRLDEAQRRTFEAAGAHPKVLRPTDGRASVNAGSLLDEAATRTNSNLTLPLTSFVGRDAEIGEISALVRNQRLVTLTGTGGIGKTRIALHVATTFTRSMEAGVWFVDLTSLTDGSLIAAAIARELTLTESTNRSLLETLVAYLKEKMLLLVLDNCEHIIAEAATIADALLRGCPALRILTTSREPLRAAGEQLYRLPSLGVPSADAACRLTAADAVHHGSVSLFTDRARAVENRFTLTDDNAPIIAEICRRLDGIPLAIELAAARVPVLSVKALCTKLDQFFRVLRSSDRTPLLRHQTMRALIDWSHDLLNERERTLFRRLSVFAGGWSLEGCIEVCSDNDIDDEWEVFELLASLVAKSLVMADEAHEEPRYRLLESTLSYARERLASSGEAERLAHKHALHYAKYLRDQRDAWEAMDDLGWQRAVTTELDNVRGALDWTIRAGNDRKLGLEMLAQIMSPTLIFDPTEARNWYGLGCEWLNEIDDKRIAAAFRCRCAATNARFRAPVTLQIAACQENVAEARLVGDTALLAESLKDLGLAYWRARRFDEADTMFAEGWSVLDSGSMALAARITADWAVNDAQRGNLESARKRFYEALRIARPRSHAHTLALMGLAEVEFLSGRHRDARVLAHDAMAGFSALGMTMHRGVVCCNLASYAVQQGALEEARESLVEALKILRAVGLEYWLTEVLEQHAVFAAMANHDEPAVALLGYAQQQDALLGRVREQRGYDRAVLLLRQRLGDEEFARRLTHGASLSESQALAYATDIENRCIEPRGSETR
jgi:predicted ATPase/DNA-binding XRE family transcriptional regulator